MAVKKDVVEQSLIEPQNSFSSETITEQDIIKGKYFIEAVRNNYNIDMPHLAYISSKNISKSSMNRDIIPKQILSLSEAIRLYGMMDALKVVYNPITKMLEIIEANHRYLSFNHIVNIIHESDEEIYLPCVILHWVELNDPNDFIARMAKLNNSSMPWTLWNCVKVHSNEEALNKAIVHGADKEYLDDLKKKSFSYSQLKSQMQFYQLVITNSIVSSWFDGEETQHNTLRDGDWRVNKDYLPLIKECLENVAKVALSNSVSLNAGEKFVLQARNKKPSLSFTAPTSPNQKFEIFFMRRLAMLFYPYRKQTKGANAQMGRTTGRNYFKTIFENPVEFSSFISSFFSELQRHLNMGKNDTVPYINDIDKFNAFIDRVETDAVRNIGGGKRRFNLLRKGQLGRLNYIGRRKLASAA